MFCFIFSKSLIMAIHHLSDNFNISIQIIKVTCLISFLLHSEPWIDMWCQISWINTYLAHASTWNSSSEIVTVCGTLTFTSNLGNTGNKEKYRSAPTNAEEKTYYNYVAKYPSMHHIFLCVHLYRPCFNCPKFCVAPVSDGVSLMINYFPFLSLLYSHNFRFYLL